MQAGSNNNPGGVMATFQGVTNLPSDPNFHCPFNPTIGGYDPRTVSFRLFCDMYGARDSVKIVQAFENTTCHWVVDLLTVNACGCAPQCTNKLCGSDGCGGYCSGDALGLKNSCPDDQVCMNDQSCCRPDCSARTCGSDGCGGNCGDCGWDEICSTAGVCIDHPYPPAKAVYYTTDGGGMTGMYFVGILIGTVSLFIAWFAFFGGIDRFNDWRYKKGYGANATTDTGAPTDRDALISEVKTVIANKKLGGLSLIHI